MKITEVRLKEMEDKGSLKAFGSITLDDAFVVTGVSVREGSKGLFVSLPSYKGKDEQYHDSAFPLKKELRDEINKAVLEEFQKMKSLDKIIETVDINGETREEWGLPFDIGMEEGKAAEPKKEEPKAEKTSIKEKLKNAAEKVSGQVTKNNEKSKEVFL